VRFLAILVVASSLSAQDVIRGRIVGPDSAAIERATITVTSLRGSVSRSARTDKDGRFTIAFPGDEGDYWVSVAAFGFAAKRFEAKRLGDADVIIANAKLATAAQQLDAMKVDAVRARVSRAETPLDISGSERPTINGANGADPYSDLAALAASLPGVQLIPSSDGPNGFSVLGLAADQNTQTLNGMQFGGASLPRDANVSASVMTTPYDVSRGGFSGGMMTIRTDPASKYITRLGGINFDSPTLQWTDRAAQATGQEYRNLSIGGRISAPIAFDQSAFTIAYQAGRRASELQSLANTNVLGLQAAGLAADSVRRLVSLLQRSGIPLSRAGLPTDRFNDQASVFGTFDYMPSSNSGRAVNVTFNGAWNRNNPAMAGPTTLQTNSGSRETWYGGVQAKLSDYYLSGILGETSLGVTSQKAYGDPFLDAPAAMVRISSSFADGTSGIQSVAFGGNSDLASNQTTTNVQVMNQLSWFSTDSRHRLKSTIELRRENYAQDNTPNRLGTFAFNSLADLDANHPSAFMRTLGSRARSASQYLGAFSIGDSYRPTSGVQIQYGVRADLNQFETRPANNPSVERVFGARTDFVPNRIYLSPRVGFSWTYGQAAQIAAFDGGVRDPRATIRGGIGLFQSTPNAAQIGPVMDNTGLASSATQLACVGSAVPVPDWTSYLDGGAVPTRCADDSTGSAFATTAPTVILFDRDFRAPHSVRSNLQWSGLAPGNRFLASVDLTYSLNVNQVGVSDVNFAGVPQFTLGDDGRPVFARSASIVSATGAVGGGEGRLDPAFGRVASLRTDMRSEAKQVTLQLRPATFSSSFSWTASYVYSRTRERYRGFVSTDADPRTVAWGRSPFDSRHQIVYTLNYDALDLVRLSWYGSFRSGTPYTPLVTADINGDGFTNDRAFIADSPALRTLIDNGSASARECLRSQLGRIAARGSCQGPWTNTSNLVAALNPLRFRIPQRASLSFQLNNPLGAADLLLHGDSKLRGWGQQFVPNSQLLFVRGFDAAARTYRYEVNQRFGSTAVSQNAFRNPVTLTAMLRFDVGPTRERQSLTEMLDRGRTLPGQKVPEPIIKAAYGTNGLVNPMAQLLRQSDTLGLSAEQGDRLALINRRYMMKVDSLWAPVAKFLAGLPDRYSESEAYGRYRAAREANVDALLALAPTLRSLLTAEQWRRVPASIASFTDSRYLASIRSGTAGSMLGALMMPNGMPMPVGASNPASAVIMMHGGTP
jgi:hypothetical protein